MPETEAIRLPPRAKAVRVLRGGPVETGRGFVLHSSDYGANDSTVKIGDVCLTATLDILRAIAEGTGPSQADARAWLRRLGLRAARERDPRQRLAHLPRRRSASSSTSNFGRKYDRALAILGIDEGMLSSDAGHA